MQRTRNEMRIRIHPNGGFVGYVVQIDYDGQERVDDAFGIRDFRTREAAEKRIRKYLESL